MRPQALYNGRPAAGAWTRARGLHYGDGVFRTCLIYRSEVFDVKRQYSKICADAAALDLRAPAPRLLISEARQLAAGCNLGVLKILVWRRAGQRGYAPTTTASERLLIRSALPRWPHAHWSSGVRAVRSSVTLGAQPLLAGLKQLNRLEQVLASRGWPRGVDEAILCDCAGMPVGGTRTNLFWVVRGALYTPELSRCGVAGMMRQKVLELAQRLCIPWRIGRWPWRDLERADEAFLTNSLIGIWPLRQLERRVWAAPGPLTRSLMAALAHPKIAAE